MTISILSIAQVCHELNKAYCLALGDDSQVEFIDAPEWQVQSAVNGVQFHLDNPEAGTADSHESWYKEKYEAGWTWGPVKDEALKEHPCMVAYDLLPVEQKAKDFIFRQTVHSLKAYLV